MKTRHPSPRFSSHLRRFRPALAGLAAVALASCMREDDVLQTQLIEARAAMEQRGRELDQTQAQLNELKEKMQRLGGASASADELARLKARNAELEDQLAAARQQAATPDAPAKFDLDVMANRLEEDLTRKAKQLRELVQKQTPGGRVDEISLKSIDYPRELLATFNSAITFNILAENGQRLRLMFPVTADLGGAWKLPSPAEVQAAYQQAQSQPAQPAPAPALASSDTPPSAAVPQAAPSPAPASDSSGSVSGMRQLDANTFVFNWGDGPAAAPARPAAPAPQAAVSSPAAPAPIANFTPGAAPSPAPAPAAPVAPSRPAAPAAAPAPVMPVQQDITIRFD